MKKRFIAIGLFLISILMLTSCSIIEKEKEQIVSEKKNTIVQEITDSITRQEIARITSEKTAEIIGSTALGEQKPCTIPKTLPQFVHEQYYTGPLIDTHVHMPVSSKIVSTIAIQSGFEDMPAYDDRLSIDYLTCLFESEGIIQTFGFHLIPNMAISSSLATIQEFVERYPQAYAHFYMPIPIPSLNPSPEKMDEIVTENDFFQGYGEVKFDFHEVENQGIEDPEFLQAYAIAEKQGLVIMMHPAENQKEAVIRLLEKYPRARFLFHSGSVEGWIGDVLEKYPNAYYSLDANIVSIYGWMKDQDSATKDEFMKYMTTSFNQHLEKKVEKWKPFIEKHPDQVTWGTDRWYTWHFDEEVGSMIEEFGRSFIAKLDPEVQEKFAYKNAQQMMEE